MRRIKRTEASTPFFQMVSFASDELLFWARRDARERDQIRAPIQHDMFRSGALVEIVARDFHQRCAFCEQEISTDEGISHFRPLHSQTKEFPNSKDHYSWLAYEWHNLFLICKRCENSRAERFPLVGSPCHFLATFDDVQSTENPLIIDPTRENPSGHLAFLSGGEIFPKINSIKGNVTSELFELNDDFLLQKRKKSFESTINEWRRIIQSGDYVPDDFLASGPFLGARRNIVSRCIGRYGINGIGTNSTVTTKSLHRSLNTLIMASRPSELARMIDAIDQLQIADVARADELRARPRVTETLSSFSPSSYAVFTSPNASLVGSELRAIRIKNFKAIDKLELTFPKLRSEKSGMPCLMLLGENAVGKSTCLAAIALALLGKKESRKLGLAYSDIGRSTTLSAWDLWNREPAEVQVSFHDQYRIAEFLYDPRRQRIESPDDQAVIVLGYGPHRYFSKSGPKRPLGPADKVKSLFDPKAPIPDPTDWFATLEGEKFAQVVRTIRTILPIEDSDIFVADPKMGLGIVARDQFTPINHLSEGYRSIFGMVADICRSLLDTYPNLESARAVVLIDEIETHLHPRWKMQVMSSLRRAFPAVQFVVTTHDPLCLRGMDDGEVVVLQRNDSGGVQLVEDLPSIAGMRVEQLLTSDYFGLSSTIDPELHLEIARSARAATDGTNPAIGKEALALVKRLTVGDSASEQVIYEALRQYLLEREKPADALSENARPRAVAAVLSALRASKPKDV